MRTIEVLTLLTLLGGLMSSCEKKEQESHYDMVSRKILNYDPDAFIGKWDNYKTLTWDPEDNMSESLESHEVKISKKNWKTEDQNTPIKLYHELYCGSILSRVIFEHDSGNDTAWIQNWGGTATEMYFKIYEYPDDPEVFRIDRFYKPILN